MATSPSKKKKKKPGLLFSCLDKSELIASVSMVIKGFLVRQEKLGLPPGLAVSFVVAPLLLQNGALRLCLHGYEG